MIVLQAQHIQKSFAGETILQDASITVQDRERVAILGANGAGKSTLFKIMTRELLPDSGNIFINKQTTIGYLAQYGSLQSDQTIWTTMKEVFSHLTEMEKQIESLT